MTSHPTAPSVGRSVVAAGLTAAGLIGALVWTGTERTVPAPPVDEPSNEPSTSVAPFPALEVLHGWDRRRATAYARGDIAGLRGLYVDGGSAATADVRILRAYTGRGLTVRGMRMQVLAVTVRASEPDRYLLCVTDRLVGAVAVGNGTRVRLPRDRASTRLITLTRVSPGAPWQVASVSRSSRRPAGP